MHVRVCVCVLVVLHEAPLLFHLSCLQERTLIGRPNPENPPDIQLQGLGIHTEHCMVEMGSEGIFITSSSNARTLVNGRSVTERTQLKHGARILLGNNHLFRLSCPRVPGGWGRGGEGEGIGSGRLRDGDTYVCR